MPSIIRRAAFFRGLCLTASLLGALSLLASCSTAAREDAAPVVREALPLVHWQVSASHPMVLAEARTEQLVSIELEATLPEALRMRRPLNLSLVVDHSGSMSGAQMADAREALVTMLETLDEDDVVSVFAFSSQVTPILAHGRWGDADREAVFEAIAGLQPTGTTAMSEALSHALQSVTAHATPQQINRVLLLSDGEANDPAPLPDLARWAQGSGVAITTLGLGPYYNEATLAMLADVSGGRYRFIESSQEIAAFFLDEMRAMEQQLAHDVQLELTLGPNVELVEALGMPMQVSGRQAFVLLGSLSAGEVRRVALRLDVGAGRAGAHVEILDAALRYTPALDTTVVRVSSSAAHGEPFVAGAMQTLTAYIGAEASDDAARVEASRNLAVVEAFGRLHAAREIEQGLEFVRSGRLDEGRTLLVEAAARYQANNIVAPVELQLDALALEAAESLEAPSDDARNDSVRPAPSTSETKRLHSSTRSLSGL